MMYQPQPSGSSEKLDPGQDLRLEPRVGLNAVDALARRFHSECVPLTAIFPAAGSPSTRFTRL